MRSRSSESEEPARAGAEAPEAGHVPVLVAEVLELMAPERSGLYVDATLGLGGHAEALLERGGDAVTLLGLDRDPEALERARRRLGRFGDRVHFALGRFSDLETHLERLALGPCAGILADLGVSSMQLDVAERGFAFSLDGPLDMRMGAGEATARDIVNSYSEENLTKILKNFGEEPQARRIARAITETRRERPFERTGELAELVARVKKRRGPRGRAKIHPATQVFQALRIEVNRELEELGELLDGSVRLLERDGRLVVISYHSLEDRLVKTTLRGLERGEVDPITGRPRAETQVIEVLTRKPVRPSDAEVTANPRARSARLRAARRL